MTSTHERILESALNIFSIKGYHDTKLDEIAAESETSKGAIFFHFPNKERLVLSLVDQFADLLERRVTAAIEPLPLAWGGCKSPSRPACKPLANTAAPPKFYWCRPQGWVSRLSKSATKSTTALHG